MAGSFQNSWRGAGGHNRGAAVEADAIGEQQPKWTQSGSSCNREQHAAEADASGEQQLKRMQAGSSAAVETQLHREQQL